MATYKPTIGEKIAYTGDQANQPWDGTVVAIYHDADWGTSFDLEEDNEDEHDCVLFARLSGCQVGEYNGTCNPRFSTVESRNRWRSLKIAEMKAQLSKALGR